MSKIGNIALRKEDEKDIQCEPWLEIDDKKYVLFTLQPPSDGVRLGIYWYAKTTNSFDTDLYLHPLDATFYIKTPDNIYFYYADVLSDIDSNNLLPDDVWGNYLSGNTSQVSLTTGAHVPNFDSGTTMEDARLVTLITTDGWPQSTISAGEWEFNGKYAVDASGGTTECCFNIYRSEIVGSTSNDIFLFSGTTGDINNLIIGTQQYNTKVTYNNSISF